LRGMTRTTMRVMMLKIKDRKGDRDRQSDVQGHAGVGRVPGLLIRFCWWGCVELLGGRQVDRSHVVDR